MSLVLAAVLPIFLLILLGLLFRRTGFLGEDFWRAVERLTYYALLPALLAATLATADFTGIRVGAMAAAIILALVVMTAALLLAARLWAPDGPAYSSLVQSVLRGNTYIGLSLSLALFGEPGLAAAAIAVAAIVPLVNLLSVAVLSRLGTGGRAGPAAIAISLARNPLILACLIGILLNIADLPLPPVVAPVLEILGRAALPLGLLAVGAGLDLRAARAAGHWVASAAALRLLVMPALTALCCWLFGVEDMAAVVAILFNALPTATSSYILARQLGGDATLMASLLTVQTGLSLFTLPVILAIAT